MWFTVALLQTNLYSILSVCVIKILCAEMKINGGLIMIGDHICTTDKQESSLVISYEVATGKAMPLAKAFQGNGGAVVQEPSMQFWGQG